MSQYQASVDWQRQTEETFIDNKYSRGHLWRFDGGETVKASASPHVVPVPYSIEAHIDPEEAFIAAIASCHMLFFLSIAAKKRYVVDSYNDNATGLMQNNEQNKMAMTEVTLNPKIEFSGNRCPSKQQIDKIHDLAHQQCFIANSINSKIIIKNN
jgi:organic hydroperoxide reductase OsmC/OhrA